VILPDEIKTRFTALAPFLDERRRRLFAGAEVIAGTSIAVVAKATGLAYATVLRGVEELQNGNHELDIERVRAKGGGRLRATEIQPGLLAALDDLVQSATLGNPQVALLWVSKSRRNLAEALKKQGYQVSHTLVIP